MKTADGRVLQLTMRINEAGEKSLSGCGGADAMIRAAYMQTAAIDFGAAIIARAIESVSTVLDNFEKGA